VTNPYIGEIRMFAGTFAPNGWAFCDGQLLPISENEALFTLIGTTYGGDGESTFALPDLRGRFPLHQGGAAGGVGASLGVEEVTLTTQQLPPHTHALLVADVPAVDANPANRVLAQDGVVGADLYVEDAPNAAMAPSAVSAVGGSQPHDNLQPYLCVNFILSLYGIFPSQ
jgi:microcystin-dependent protein